MKIYGLVRVYMSDNMLQKSLVLTWICLNMDITPTRSLTLCALVTLRTVATTTLQHCSFQIYFQSNLDQTKHV